MKTRSSITVVLTAHREGLLVVPTLKSLEKSIAVARDGGALVEVMVSLDKSDKITRAIFENWPEQNKKISQLEFGDPSLCRNHCVKISSGDYIAILDADDIIGQGWLFMAAVSAQSDARPIVWHPEVNIIFGETDHIFRHVDMEDPEFDILSMVAANPWTSLCFAQRDAFLRVPYTACDFGNGVGHEDWAWNRHVVEIGYLHKIVKGTGHAIRRKSLSYVKQASSANVLPAGTTLFRRQLGRRMAVSTDRAPIAAGARWDESGAPPNSTGQGLQP
jgi:hypothetical protein